jgi:predicted phage terminase large subunit-like protein
MNFPTRSIPRSEEELAKEQQAQIIGPQPGPQEDFFACSARIIGYGGAAGSGKSRGLLLKAMRYAALEPKPGYLAVIFRQTMPQVTQPGGLWDESQQLYRLAEGKSNQTYHDWTWPQHDTKIRFASMQRENDRFDWLGSQLAFIGFDELVHFSEEQFFFMLSRLRTTSGITAQICATMNPDPDSWVKVFFAPWVDADYDGPGGRAASGEIRYFVRDRGLLRWLDPGETHPDAMSVTFIAASIFDNPALLEADPGYLSALKALPAIECQRLLYGDWSTRQSGALFKRHWFPVMDAAPEPKEIARVVRYWDLAATEPSETNKDPDWTCGIKVAKLKNNTYVILDVQRVRHSSAKVETLIRRTAKDDGRSVAIYMEQEGGSAGKTVIDSYRRNVLAGFSFHGIRPTGNKATRATPVASQAEHGNIALVRGYWNDALLRELAAFPSPKDRVHDDQVDALSGAMEQLFSRSGQGHVEWSQQLLQLARKKRPKQQHGYALPRQNPHLYITQRTQPYPLGTL